MTVKDFINHAPDMQCTFWPDTWLGVVLTPCCILHDLVEASLSGDLNLCRCVVDTFIVAWPTFGALFGVIMGWTMFLGVSIPGPAFRKIRSIIQY